MVDRHPELSNQNPMRQLTEKARLVPPPIDMEPVAEIRAAEGGRIERNPRTLFVETRDADVGLLNTALGMVDVRGEKFDLVTVGPVEALSEDYPRRALPEADDLAHIRAMFQAGVVVSVKPSAASDFLAVRALAAGCVPVFPATGVYPELLPTGMHREALYPVNPDGLARCIIQAMADDIPLAGDDHDVRKTLRQFDAIPACRLVDERLTQLADAHAEMEMDVG